MMQDHPRRPTDLALVNDTAPDMEPTDPALWYGRKMPKGTPWLTPAGAYHAWTSGSLYPTYDLAEDVREIADRRGRGWRVLLYVLVLAALATAATWAIWSGK